MDLPRTVAAMMLIRSKTAMISIKVKPSLFRFIGPIIRYPDGQRFCRQVFRIVQVTEI
jgi:hypothetical protein